MLKDDILGTETPAAVSVLDSALSALSNIAKTRTVEIDLPILNCKVLVHPVNGSEELRLRTLKSSGSTFIHSFNQVILDHCKFDGIDFDDLKDFEDHLTIPDKSILVAALLDATFTTLPERLIKCPNCGKTDTYSPEPSALFHDDTIKKTWEEKEDFRTFEIKSEIVPGVTIVYEMPTETDRSTVVDEKDNAALRDNLEENNQLLNQIEMFCVYIKRMEIQNGEEIIILEDKLELLIPTIKKMPMELQAKLLDDQTLKQFVDYNPTFYLDLTCSNALCSKKDFKWDDIQPEQDFFRKTLSVYN